MGVKQRIAKAAVFAFSWGVIGWFAAQWLVSEFLTASFGGVFEPPAIWRLCRDLGLTLVPAVLLLGGTPAAIQIARNQQWKLVAITTFSASVFLYLWLTLIVLWGHEIFGWSW
jgi:hypothetical protein